MNKRGVSAIIITIILVALALIAVGIVWTIVNKVIRISSTPTQQKLDGYCLEWNHNIARENMFLNCYDFKDQKFGCLWYIDENQILHIYESSNDWRVNFRALNDFWKEIDNLEEIGNYTCTKYISDYYIRENEK